MQYKTIILEMLEQRPRMREELRQSRKLLSTMERYATELKSSHEAWKERLREARPGSDPSQIASEAMELALKDMEDRLPSESAQDESETLSLDRRNGASGSSFVARLKASRNQRSLFDSPPKSPAAAPEPPQLDSPPPVTPVPMPPPTPLLIAPTQESPESTSQIASGEKAKARDIIAAIRTLKRVETERRPPNKEEKDALARFSGFGPVALSIFPDPVSGHYKDAGWRNLGETLQMLLTPEEYESAKRTTFNAFYTSPAVIASIHEAIDRLGVPDDATILEPGCGIGNFIGKGKSGQRFIGSRAGRYFRTDRESPSSRS